MDTYTYGIQSQEPTGSIVVRIVGESESTAAPKLSSAIAGAKVAFFRVGKEPGRFSISDSLQLSISSDVFKFILDLTHEDEDTLSAFCDEHKGQFVEIAFSAMLKRELDGSDYQTKKGVLFGLITGLTIKPARIEIVARSAFMQRRRMIRDLVTGQDKAQSGNLSD